MDNKLLECPSSLLLSLYHDYVSHSFKLFSTTQNFFLLLSISLSGRAKWRHHMRQILISRGPRRRRRFSLANDRVLPRFDKPRVCDRDERRADLGKREVGACAAHITHMFMKKLM